MIHVYQFFSIYKNDKYSALKKNGEQKEIQGKNQISASTHHHNKYYKDKHGLNIRIN